MGSLPGPSIAVQREVRPTMSMNGGALLADCSPVPSGMAV
jgi:hypothetical protein